ncbi:MAG TPA: carbon storage regulator CsrA [Clostridiales bacterium]|nr:carbon storage regulator CsrA [Clostridiales bacterium]
MLVFARKPQESFMIGDDIEVVILEIQNDKVRLGIKAPKDVQILRKELYDTKVANRDALDSIETLQIDDLKNIKIAIKKDSKP